jgi:hypothetical protein
MQWGSSASLRASGSQMIRSQGARVMTKRWWVPNAYPNQRVVHRAFEWLDMVTPRHGSAALVVAARTKLHGGDIEHVLGAHAIKLLTSKRVWRLPLGGQLEAIPMHGNRGDLRISGPLLLVYASHELLRFADRIQGVTEILAVPWRNSDVASWVVRWGAGLPDWTADWRAAEFRRSQPVSSATHGSLDPVVNMALRELFGSFIDHDDTVRQEDRPLLVGLLTFLRENGVTFTPEQIRSWVATMQGGHPMLADDLARLVRDVIAGRNLERLQLWGKDSLVRWRQTVERKESPAGSVH